VPVFLPRHNPDSASVGRVIEGFEVRVADEQNDPLPPQETGEILVRSSEPCAVMLGYDGDPAGDRCSRGKTCGFTPVTPATSMRQAIFISSDACGTR
jgi:acyl-coenzyme A synthetase/AMP-(fatty) acid ligase